MNGYSLTSHLHLGDLAESRFDKVLEYYINNRLERPFFITVHSYSVHIPVHTFKLAQSSNQFSRKISQDFKDKFSTLHEKIYKVMKLLYNNKPEKLYEIISKDNVDKNKDYFSGEFSEEKFKGLRRLVQTPSELVVFHQLVRGLTDPLFKLKTEDFLLSLLLSLDSSIYETDISIIKGLWDILKNARIDDRTIIIITADHGDEYYEHGLVGHGQHLYDESIHVPLIMHIPGMSRPLRIKELVQSIDILPTVLELLAIPVPAQAQGISLLGILEGRKDAVRNEVIFCQTTADRLAIRSNKWKLIESVPLTSAIQDSDELYNLRDDPGEQHNLIRAQQKVAEDLKKQLNEWRESLIVYQPDENEFMPGIDEETKERIRKTGYW